MATEMPLSAVQYPLLEQDGYEEKSPASNRCNCIAWAVEDVKNVWWPHPKARWPHSIPKQETIAAFVTMFRARGYVQCETGDLEQGFQKLALYALNQAPKHAARQLPSGRWTSKIGRNIDIEHTTPRGLEGPFYGSVVVYFKKRVPTATPSVSSAP